MVLEKKFNLIYDKSNMISENGSYGNVYKVYDNNGNIYCGKIPKGVKLASDFYKKTNRNAFLFPEFIKMVEHENFIAQEIYKNYDLTFKPEGVYDIEVNKSGLYIPGFVTELAPKDFILKKDLTQEMQKVARKEANIQLKKLISEGYYMYSDVLRGENLFYSEKKGIKFIDFGLWGIGEHWHGCFEEGYYDLAMEFTKKEMENLSRIK